MRGDVVREVDAPTHRARVGAITTVALVAFASNSILCRLALSGGAIDAASFTTTRVLSGALVLALLSRPGRSAGSWSSAAALVAYAVAFSFAYVSLSAGVGALLLFGAVQAAILLSALRAGERAPALEWVGLTIALAGLVYLVSPGLTAPPFLGSALMIAAGVAWGVYTIRGRGATDPLRATAGNFARSAPLVCVISAIVIAAGPRPVLSTRGVLLALASGALTSGLGYVVWYTALQHLTAIRAATVQLAVPVITAAGGILLLGERLTVRLVLAAAMILGGIAVAVASRTLTESIASRPS